MTGAGSFIGFWTREKFIKEGDSRDKSIWYINNMSIGHPEMGAFPVYRKEVSLIDKETETVL